MNILSTVTHKARKEHICNFCGGKILPSEKYESSAIIGDDGFYTWKNHPSCWELCGVLEIDHDDYGITADDFSEACREYCQDVICPNCDKWDTENRECNDDKWYCLEKIKEKIL